MSKRILVAVKSVEEAEMLTRLAASLAPEGGVAILVHVIELPDPTPLDADIPDLEGAGHEALEAAERVARLHGFDVVVRLLRARDAGDALIDEMESAPADMAVIGYHHDRTFRDFMLGTTSQYLMKHTPCPLVCLVPARGERQTPTVG